MDIDTIQHEINELAESDAPPDERLPEILRLREVSIRALDAAKAAKALIDDALLAHLIATRSEVVIGEKRIYAGNRKVTKCRDNARLLDHLLALTSVDEIAALLASDAFKPGAARDVLGDAWDGHFTVEIRPELHEGKPKKRLIETDTRFPGK